MITSCGGGDNHNPISVNERVDPYPTKKLDLPHTTKFDSDSAFVVSLREQGIEVVFRNDTSHLKDLQELSDMIDIFDVKLIKDKIFLEADSMVVMGRFQEAFKMFSDKGLGKVAFKMNTGE